MTRLKNLSLPWLLLFFMISLAPLSGGAEETPPAPTAAPAVQPLGNLTKEEPDEKYVHLQTAKLKVEKLVDGSHIPQAVEAQRQVIKIAQEEFGSNRLIQLEEMLVLADLLQQEKKNKEADELLTEISTLMDDCPACPAPFLEGLHKRLDQLRAGEKDVKTDG